MAPGQITDEAEAMIALLRGVAGGKGRMDMFKISQKYAEIEDN